ncbi:hypothetical protein AAE478_001721 [Parahypoxylon ruwenzoriense]
MASAPTSKELMKAINNFIQTASFPLPDDLIEIIDSFLYKNEKFDEAVADKVHDELLSIFHKDVAQVPSRSAAFIAILRRLRPVIGQPAKIFQWFDLLLSILNYLNQEKGLASEAEGVLLDILTADDGNDSSSPTGGAATQLAERTLLLWLDEYETISKTTDAISEFKEKQLRKTLVMYGKRRPKAAVDADKERRLSPNIFAWEKLAYSSDFDDTAIPQLLHYFTILYGLYPINFMDYIRKPQRYLRHAEVPDADDIEVQPTEIRHASERFRQCHLLHENFYTLTIDSEKTDFGRWIKSEPPEVVADCIALCLSGEAPNNLNIPDVTHGEAPEKDDPDKDGHEPALLSRSYTLGTPAFGAPQRDTRRNTSSTLAESISSSRMQSTVVRKSSQSSHQSNRDPSSPRPFGSGGESPTLSRQIVQSGSQTQLQDLINSNKVIKSGLHQSMANDSVPSLALSHHDSISDRPGSQLQPNFQDASASLSPTNNVNAQIAHLQRQVLLLYNDLTFERFMKQQHLTHMGELRRRHVREAASEAETQNLIIQNRHLKQRLDDAKKSEIQAKKESDKRSTLAKKWEAELMTKLKTLREEQKKWNAERKTLQGDLDAAKGEADKLRLLVCEAEVRELSLKQNMQSVEINVSEFERLRKEVEQLTESERNYQAKETGHQAAITRETEADNRVEILEGKLKAHNHDSQRMSDLYQSQITVLNAKLQDALKSGAERRSGDIKSQVENVLAASRERQTELKNRITELMKKSTALQSTILDLRSTISDLSKPDRHPPTDPEVDFSSESGSPLTYKNRQHRGFSDSETPEATSYNPTPPLEQSDAGGSMGPQGRRPSTPLGADAVSAGKGSPTTERYFGRGGVQNLRKDKKDKKDEKERKRSAGLRGIRGFV